MRPGNARLDLPLAVLAFAVATLAALAFGAGLGTAFTFGTIAFVAVLVARMLLPFPRSDGRRPGDARAERRPPDGG